MSLSLVWALVFALDLLPILRGGYDWAWHYKPILDRYRAAPIVLGLLVYVPIGLWLKGQARSRTLLLWALLGCMGLTLGAVHLRGDVLYRLYSLTVSGRASGWHMAAGRIEDLPLTLRQWPAFMLASGSYSSHIDHSPPGMVLVFYALGHMLDKIPAMADWMAGPLRWLLCQYMTGYTGGQYASAWIGILMPLWGSLTVIPLYFLGREVFDRDAARWSVLWWPLVPSFLAFAPLPYTSYALPALVMVAILWQGLRTDGFGCVVAAGALLSVLSFLNFVFAPLLLFSGLSTLGVYWLRNHTTHSARLPWHWPLRVGVCYAIGLSMVWLIFQAATGVSFWSIWRTAQETQVQVARVRPYWPFLAWNINDFGMFTGWPLVLLAALGTWTAGHNIAENRQPKESDVMILVAAATLILVDVSGTPRGETGRLLLFLAPWQLYAAAYGLRRGQVAGGLLTATQALAVLVVIICLQVLAPEFKARAAPAAPAARIPIVEPALHKSGAVFEDSIRLSSFAGRIESRVKVQGSSEQVLYLWLTWDALRTMDVHYAYLARPTPTAGEQWMVQDPVAPFDGEYPMTCWKPGETNLRDRLRLSLKPAVPGAWWVDLAIVDPTTGRTLPVVAVDGTRTQEVRLGPFEPSP